MPLTDQDLQELDALHQSLSQHKLQPIFLASDTHRGKILQMVHNIALDSKRALDLFSEELAPLQTMDPRKWRTIIATFFIECQNQIGVYYKLWENRSHEISQPGNPPKNHKSKSIEPFKDTFLLTFNADLPKESFVALNQRLDQFRKKIEELSDKDSRDAYDAILIEAGVTRVIAYGAINYARKEDAFTCAESPAPSPRLSPKYQKTHSVQANAGNLEGSLSVIPLKMMSHEELKDELMSLTMKSRIHHALKAKTLDLKYFQSHNRILDTLSVMQQCCDEIYRRLNDELGENSRAAIYDRINTLGNTLESNPFFGNFKHTRKNEWGDTASSDMVELMEAAYHDLTIRDYPHNLPLTVDALVAKYKASKNANPYIGDPQLILRATFILTSANRLIACRILQEINNAIQKVSPSTGRSISTAVPSASTPVASASSPVASASTPVASASTPVASASSPVASASSPVASASTSTLPTVSPDNAMYAQYATSLTLLTVRKMMIDFENLEASTKEQCAKQIERDLYGFIYTLQKTFSTLQASVDPKIHQILQSFVNENPIPNADYASSNFFTANSPFQSFWAFLFIMTQNPQNSPENYHIHISDENLQLITSLDEQSYMQLVQLLISIISNEKQFYYSKLVDTVKRFIKQAPDNRQSSVSSIPSSNTATSTLSPSSPQKIASTTQLQTQAGTQTHSLTVSFFQPGANTPEPSTPEPTAPKSTPLRPEPLRARASKRTANASQQQGTQPAQTPKDDMHSQLAMLHQEIQAIPKATSEGNEHKRLRPSQ